VIGYYFSKCCDEGVAGCIGILCPKTDSHAFGLCAILGKGMKVFPPDGEIHLRIFFYVTIISLERCIIPVFLLILILWDKVLTKKHRFFQIFSAFSSGDHG